MAGPLDHQLMLGVESTYGTAVTPTRGVEFDFESTTHGWDPKAITGSGMQPGDGGISRASRSVAIIGQGAGAIGFDLQSKGLGMLLNGLFGNGASSLVSGTTYQQVFTTASTNALMPSYTMQLGVVRSDASGTVDPYTYRGTTFTSLGISCDPEAFTRCTMNWDAMAQTTATGLATASYPAGLADAFSFADWTATFGGTVTVPTNIALASVAGGTVVNDFKNFGFEWDRAPDLARWVLGGTRNQPRFTRSQPTIAIGSEYNSLMMDTALTGYATNSLVLTGTKSSQPLSTGFAQCQLVFPALKLPQGDRPQASAETPTTANTFNVHKPETGAAMYLVLRTADAAL